MKGNYINQFLSLIETNINAFRHVYLEDVTIAFISSYECKSSISVNNLSLPITEINVYVKSTHAYTIQHITCFPFLMRLFLLSDF